MKKFLISANGKSLTASQWEKLSGIPAQNIRARLHLGWDPGKAVTEPLQQSGRKLTTADFIIRAKKVHGSRYRYSRSVYKTNKLPVIITCLTHGNFQQLPIHHWAGHGCPECGKRKRPQLDSVSVTGS